MTKRERMNLNLDPHVAGLLRQAGKGVSIADYLETIVRERWGAWQGALEWLRAAGWVRNEVLAAMDALNGLALMSGRPHGDYLALSLHDAGRLDGVHAKWGVDADAWAARVEGLRGDDDQAWALWALTREFWAMNPACEQAIRRLPEERGKPTG